MHSQRKKTRIFRIFFDELERKNLLKTDDLEKNVPKNSKF